MGRFKGVKLLLVLAIAAASVGGLAGSRSAEASCLTDLARCSDISVELSDQLVGQINLVAVPWLLDALVDTCPVIVATFADVIPTPATRDGVEKAVVCLTNEERAKATASDGIPRQPSQINAKLVAAARAHSQDMVSRHYFSHCSNPAPSNATACPGGTTSKEDRAARYTAAGYYPCGNTGWAGENLKDGGTARQAVAAWMNSAGHREQILFHGHTEIGVGLVIGSYNGGLGTTYTEDFGACN